MDNGTSLSGRARRFAEEVNDMHCSMNDAVDGNCERIGLGTIPVDDVIWQAKLLLIQQEQFRRQGKPTAVDVGYLYTSDKNNSNNWRRRIRNNGLMTRQSEQHRSGGGGGGNSILAQYGDGIYTSSNPYSYHLHHHGVVDDGNNNMMPDDDSMRSFVGLFVLRLIGKALDPFEARMLAASSSVTTTSAGTNNREDCCAVNQGTGDEWMVLRQASQCIAVISFPASLVRPDTTNSAYSGNVIVYGYHCKLQAIVDQFFNHQSSTPTQVTGTSPDPAVLKAATPPPEEQQGGGGGGTFPQQQQHQRQPRRHQRSASLPNAASAAVNNENRNTNNNNGDKKKNNPFRGFAKSLGLARNNNNRSTIASSDQVAAGLSGRNSSSGRRNDHPTVIVVPDSTGDGLVAIPMAHIATVSYVAPERITSRSSGTGTNSVECFLCNNARKFRDDAPSVRCSSCRIEFHLECITTELVNKRRNTCPHCGGIFGALRGPSPAGTMRISTSKNLHCSSVSRGSVGIVYDMPAAVQKPYHKHPGHHHAGTKRTALLPATPEGLDLLKRLQAAFLQGLTFRVGTSMTTGKHNSVVWASIPHKTHPTSGPPFGFPDPHYIVTCNAILDALGVPPDDEL